MSRFERHRPILAVLGAGLLLRLVLAYVVFPGQGYAGDLDQFASWAATLAKVGPGGVYASASSLNYPPGYLYILWFVGALGGPVGSLFGISSEQAIVLLLKLPTIAADIAIAVLLYRAAGRWFGGRAGMIAAALYLFLPVTWYDSALWGQVDAIGALVMLAAVLLLIEGWSESAAVLAVVGVLVKPQDLICLVIVIPVLVRRHLLRVGSGPVPALGTRLARLDLRLGGLLRTQGPVRLATSALSATVVGIAMLVPFDITRYAVPALADVPVLGHVAGLVGLFISVGGQFSVLTANAYNAWALVGPNPLTAVLAGSSGSWTADSLLLPGGLAAVTVGAVLLAAVGLLVAGGLLRRDGRLPIVLGLSLLALAFYVLPTRVHERYLFPFFAVAPLLVVGALSSAGYVGVGLLNTINLHAVLASGLAIGGGGAGFGGRGSGAGGAGSGIGGATRGVTGGFGGRGGATQIQLPFGDLARNEVVVTAVAIGQTAALIALVVAWLVVIVSGLPDRVAVGAPASA